MKPESSQLTGATAIYAEHTLRVANDKIAHNPEVITVQQATLQNVLSNSLHNIPADKAGEVAVLLACAVKSAFDALNTVNVEDDNSAFQNLNTGFATGGYVSKDAIEEAVIKSTAPLADNISLLNSIVNQLQVAVSHARTR